MGSLLWRDGGRRLVVQWFDAAGRRRQKSIRVGTTTDGAPSHRRTVEREARRQLAELELEADRQRAGLSPLNTEVLDRKLSYLVGWWWDQRGKALRSPSVKQFLQKHLGVLLDEPLRNVTAARVHRLLHTDLVHQLEPKSRKHLRAYLYNVYSEARREGAPWAGRPNPIDDVDPIRVPRKPRAILLPEEMAPVLARIPSRWRGPCAVALYAGLREGEIFGLRKSDVDLVAGTIEVHRSWAAARTKDGKPRVAVIAGPLRPYLEEALKSPSQLLFPSTKGTMYPSTLRLGKRLRRALVAAGLVIGYEHRCRAWRCGWRELRPEAKAPEACPKCKRATTWSKALPRHVRFHDTRHSFGTLMVRTAGLAAAQQGLGHSDIRLTAETYSHLDLADLRAGILRAFPEELKPAEPPPHLQVVPKGS